MQIEKLYEKFLSSSGVTTDTRAVSKGNIFFALKGEKFNANLFAAEAFEKDAQYVVVDEVANAGWEEKFGVRLILVKDSLKTLQQLAGYHRSKLRCPILAITGSNGKTTTKELIAAVLSRKYKTYATKGNLNNHIGIPLTLLSIKTDAEFAIVEMGANHQGEIASYCEYVQPDYGLITNVGNAHLEGFGGIEGVLKGKTELYVALRKKGGKIFVNGENETLLTKIYDFGFDKEGYLEYGFKSRNGCIGSIIPNEEFLRIQTAEGAIHTNLVGDYNFENVMSAVCIGKYFDVEFSQIKEAIESYTPSNNRSQKISYGSNTIILDAYNANPSSMQEALRNFEKIETKNKVAILGEMMELGDYSKVEHEKVKLQTDKMQLVKRVFVGTGFQYLQNDQSVLWFEKTEDAKLWFKQQQIKDSYILIKGSRKNELEKILKD